MPPDDPLIVTTPLTPRQQQHEFKRRNIPPSLHPDVFEARGYEADEFVTAARNALQAGRVAAQAALELSEAHLANEMLTLPARHRAARDHVFRATKPALERFDSTVTRLTDKIQAMQQALRGPQIKTDAVSTMLRAEVRQALARLDTKRRRELVIKAIGDGDEDTMAAVLHGPWYLANSSVEEQQQFRLDWQRRAHPAELERLAMLERVLEHVQSGGKLLLEFSLLQYDSHIIEKAEKFEKKAAEATARLSVH